MTKEAFLTLRWNNLLTVGLGLGLLAYVYFVASTSVLTDSAGFFGLVIFGVGY